MMMIFKTRFGTLDLPKDDCITCIYVGKYMSCSTCDFKNGLVEAATEPYIKRQIMIEQAGELYKSPETPSVKVYGGEWSRPLVVVAGTFNRFHSGHRALIIRAVWEALKKGACLIIGVTTDTFAEEGRTVPVRPRTERADEVFRFASEYMLDLVHAGIFDKTVSICMDEVESKDDMPFLVMGDVLVASEETADNARRLTDGMGCDLVVLPMLKDEYGREIHATNIIKDEERNAFTMREWRVKNA